MQPGLYVLPLKALLFLRVDCFLETTLQNFLTDNLLISVFRPIDTGLEDGVFY